MDQNKISKGGIIGAITGVLISFKTHNNNDSTGKKILKTGTGAAAGFFIGLLIERIFHSFWNKNKNRC
jgi:uncharacterized protein YcfJ